MSTVTPGRVTVVTFDINEKVLGEQSWTLERKAHDIHPQKKAGLITSSDVYSANGDAWILRPQFHEAAQALKSTIGGYVQPADVELATGMASFSVFNRRDDLPGLSPDASVPATGANTFKKRVAATDDWDAAKLAFDEAAMPPPAGDATQMYPLDRVLSGLVTYPSNTPFMVRVTMPEGYAGVDAFLRFYFGGETATAPDGTSGGHFCLTFRGGGGAELHERDEVAGAWELRQEFEWDDAMVGSGAVTKGQGVIPYSRNRILFAGKKAVGFSLSGHNFPLNAAGVGVTAGQLSPTSGNRTLYRDLASDSGHNHTDFATGEGTIRVDTRRDLTIPFSIIKGVFPLQGVLIDHPFEINRPLVVGSRLTVAPLGYNYQPPSTEITVRMFSAEDDTELANPSVDEPLVFLSLLGVRKYYCVFTFTSVDTIGTPVLHGYMVDTAGGYTTRTGANLQSVTKAVSIIGPDLEPTQDEAHVFIQDPGDALTLLRTRDGLRSRISVYDSVGGTLISHLFEGETAQTKAQLRGSPGQNYPVANWYDYDVRLSGLYPRIEEQFHDAPPFAFVSSRNSPHPQLTDPASKGDSGYDPWLVTDVIHWLLNHAGFDEDELDIPAIDFRLWLPNPIPPDAYAIQPGVSYGAMAVDLLRNLLGAALIRDPNAGARGMWRASYSPPLSSSNYLWTFDLDAPPSTGKIVTYPGAYGASTSFVLGGSYRSYIKRPVGNVVTVYGTETAPDGGTGATIHATLKNFLSLTDSSSPDYLGRTVPITRGVDQFLQTQEACNWVADRIYEQTAHAQKWHEWIAPLVLVTDPLDALQARLRMLRINDLVYLRRNETLVPCIVRSVNPDWSQSDGIQLAHYEARLFI